MMHDEKMAKLFYGTTTLGEKGQAVIPAEARKKMKLEKGEKLLVFSFDDDVLVFSKVGKLEKFASHLAGELEDIKNIISKSNK
jgi:AbrB family looped-hinge helix DNA binding protein